MPHGRGREGEARPGDRPGDAGEGPRGWKGDDTTGEAGAQRPVSLDGSGPEGDAGDVRDHQESIGLRMSEMIELGDISIAVTRKEIKNVHLSVHPPDGRVTLSAPTGTRPEVARAYAISKLGWIREQQAKLRNQARETPRQFVERESHYLWGRRLSDDRGRTGAKPAVSVDHKRITLSVRPGSDRAKRAKVIHEWHKSLLHEFIPPLIDEVGAETEVQSSAISSSG